LRCAPSERRREVNVSSPLHACVAVAIVVVCVSAAVTDARAGKIPNFLTLPSVFLGFALNVAFRGWNGALASTAGIAACALVPLSLYRATGGRAIGGGDVKLFAAIGALGGAIVGIEIQLFSFFALAAFAALWLAFRGALTRVLVNTFWFAIGPVLPKRYRRTICPENTTEMRLGPAIAVSAALVVLYERLWG
jgi:prepilin peptidase CpaA